MEDVLKKSNKKQKELAKEYGENPVTIYWWNMGTKTKSFSGTITNYLKDRGIKFTPIYNPVVDIPGYRFKIYVSSETITYDIYGDSFNRSAISAIKVFHTMMGDRTLIETINRSIKVNWY